MCERVCVRAGDAYKKRAASYFIFEFLMCLGECVCVREEPFSKKLHFPPSSFSILCGALLLQTTVRHTRRKIFHWFYLHMLRMSKFHKLFVHVLY